ATAVPKPPEHTNICEHCKTPNGLGASSCAGCGAPFQRQLPAAPVVFAPIERRLGAWLIDSFIMCVLAGLVFIAILVVSLVAGMDDEDARSLAILLTLVFMSGVGWLYFAFMDSSRSQGTLGKKMLGIVVTDLAGARISFARATGRYFAKGLTFSMCGIGPVAALFSDKKQGLHDMLAGTMVMNGKQS
ncbi:MAG TPA: RDD family protein, partial [Blastocatellia bacterium]